MKQPYLIIITFVLAASFYSCSKSDSSDSMPTNYRIDGIHDIELQPSGVQSASLNLGVVATEKIQEYVALSLADMPPGTSGKFSVKGGYPAFNSTVTFYDSTLGPGTYPIRLVCEGSETGKRSYQFNMVVKPEIDYGSDLVGSYPYSSNSCTHSNGYVVTVTSGDKPNKIYLYNFDNTGRTIYANITNNGRNFDVPLQDDRGATYKGTGTIIDTASLGIDLMAVYNSESINCHVSIYK